MNTLVFIFHYWKTILFILFKGKGIPYIWILIKIIVNKVKKNNLRNYIKDFVVFFHLLPHVPLGTFAVWAPASVKCSHASQSVVIGEWSHHKSCSSKSLKPLSTMLLLQLVSKSILRLENHLWIKNNTIQIVYNRIQYHWKLYCHRTWSKI